MRFTDIHHHLLYCVDDGPRSKESMYAMLDAAAADGIGRIVCTPHIAPGMDDFDYRQYSLAFLEAQAYCADTHSEMKLYTGAEVFYTGMTPMYLDQQRLPTLADTDRVLIEFDPKERFEAIEKAVEHIIAVKHVPVIAHVERLRALLLNAALAEKMHRSMKVRFQVNCSTVVEPNPREARFLKQMFEMGCIDAVATDAHNIRSRPACMKTAYRVLVQKYGKETAVRLTDGSIFFD